MNLDDNWIPCLQQSPPVDEILLVYQPEAEKGFETWFAYIHRSSGLWTYPDGMTADKGMITHWQRRPGPPKGLR